MTLRVTWRTVPSAFSTMLVQASERRSSCGRPRRMTVRISSSPSRMLPETPGALRQRALFASSWSQATERLLGRRRSALVDLAALDGRSTRVDGDHATVARDAKFFYAHADRHPMTSRSSSERSEASQAFIFLRDSATKRRETADFEVPSPRAFARSPSGRPGGGTCGSTRSAPSGPTRQQVGQLSKLTSLPARSRWPTFTLPPVSLQR